jgi:hypothetical protein
MPPTRRDHAVRIPWQRPPHTSVNNPDMFDAYVRIPLDELRRIEPWHLDSGVDLDATGAGPPDPGAPVDGYTEWAADAPRTLSMGWDWQFDPDKRQLTALWHTLRTNIMVVDGAGTDFGRERTRQCIAELIGGIDWQTQAAEAVGLPAPFRH